MKDEIDLRAYVDVLARRWKLVAAMPILAVVAALVVGFLTKPVYEATATVALAPSTISVLISTQQPPYYLLVDSPRRLPTAFSPAYYVSVLKSADVADAVSPRLPVTISPNSADKSLIEITARGEDPRLVAQVANTWAQAGAQRIEKLLQPTGAEASLAQQRLEAVERALAKFAGENGLGDDDLERLRFVDSLPADKKAELERLLRARDVAENVTLEFARDVERETILAATAHKPTAIDAPVPDAPVAPRPLQNSLVGAALGLLLGILGAFAVEFVARPAKTAR